MKKEQIATHYVFLDTSVFINENYFFGNKLKAFFKHAANDDIILLTTQITINECLSHLEQDIEASHGVLKQITKDLNNKAKILKNVEAMDSLWKISGEFDVKEESQKLRERFLRFIKRHFEVIELNNAVLPGIVDDYFNTKPPFGVGKKKSEFPDAIVLNTLQLWGENRDESIYVVSIDTDMLSFNAERLIPIKEYDKLLDTISYTFSEDHIAIKIEMLIEEKKPEILAKVLDEVADKFPMDGFDDSQGFEYEVIDVEFLNATIANHSILYFTDNVATVELEVEADAVADIAYEDTNMATYDKEDDRWYNVDHVKRKITNSLWLEVSIEVSVELPGKFVWNDWEFKEIARGLPSDISIHD